MYNNLRPFPNPDDHDDLSLLINSSIRGWNSTRNVESKSLVRDTGCRHALISIGVHLQSN